MAYHTRTVRPSYASRRPDLALTLVAKSYAPDRPRPDGATLLFFHCAGSHKECFEPTILRLLGLTQPPTGAPCVREAWTFDMQSHGEAAALNHDALQSAEPPVEEWGDALKMFLASGVLAGHKLVPVGHSLGATAVLIALTPGALPMPDFQAVILVEPPLITRESWNEHVAERLAALAMMDKAVSKRRDSWGTRDEARAYFEQRIPWAMWDPRVLALYVEHGLRELRDPDGTRKVVLACTKVQENAAYKQYDAHFVVLDTIRNLDRAIPIHWILGERVDLVPEYCHDSVMALRPIASLQRVPDSGHFITQENPDGLARAIGQILTGAVAPRAAL